MKVKMIKTIWLEFGLFLQKGKTYNAKIEDGRVKVEWSDDVSVVFNNSNDFEVVVNQGT